jgi:hypothetical protein
MTFMQTVLWLISLLVPHHAPHHARPQWREEWLAELHHGGARMLSLANSRGFVCGVLLRLSLGIGGNIAAFSFINAAVCVRFRASASSTSWCGSASRAARINPIDTLRME